MGREKLVITRVIKHSAFTKIKSTYPIASSVRRSELDLKYINNITAVYTFSELQLPLFVNKCSLLQYFTAGN